MIKGKRHKIYEKYDGRCAYCGKPITIGEMQIDHISAQYLAERRGDEVDNSLDNLMPSCRACNFYKSTFSLENFRESLVIILVPNLKDFFSWRLAEQYGLVKSHEAKRIKFYFEKKAEEESDNLIYEDVSFYEFLNRLSVSAQNVILRAGINSIEGVEEAVQDKLLATASCRVADVEEIKNVLKEFLYV